MQHLFQYIAYRIRAANLHGIHSPFVFNLYNTVIKNKRIDAAYLRQALNSYPVEWEKCILVEDIDNKNAKKWAEIITDEAWTVTIDLFVCGLAFARPQQRKEHFVLK